PVVDPIALEISSYPGPESTHDIHEDHESDLHISIDDLTRSRRSEDTTGTAADGVDPEVHAAEIALVQAQADARVAAEVERVRAEAAEQRAAELARIEAEAAEQRATERARMEAEAAAQREVAAKMAAEVE